jgi:hypothetical protein
MKNLILIIITCYIAGGLISCKKSSANPTGEIAGKWNIKVDSTASGVGPVQSMNVYVGSSDDYFDFRSDNKLYIKEGATLQTFDYKQVAGNKITISMPGSADIYQNCFIDAITPNSATINFFPKLINPGGNTTKVVYLTR